MTYLKFTICLGLSLVCFGELQAKEWRGIVPLRSTRADVERLLGKENEIGRYQFEDERAFIIYSQGSCDTRAGNCICLISKDVVLEIHVTLEISRQFSDLKVDLSKLERRRERAGSSIFTYSNLDEGVRYSVNESNGEIVGVDYTPAKSDCQALIRVTKTTQPNTWLQLTPLHSSRKEVERVLGPAQVVNRSSSLHRRGTETISIRYVSDSCGSGGWWNVPIDTVEEIQLIPISVVSPNELAFDLRTFVRRESKHPESVVYYKNVDDGVAFQTRQLGDTEKVTSITYGASSRDRNLRCSTLKVSN